MKIHVIGAAGGEVTGSAYLVETSQSRVLVDCGMFQGGKRADTLNHSPIGFNEQLDAVLITHAHLDHTGRLPMLAQTGYHGPIFATPASIEMAGLILRDSARLQASDTERTNRKRQRAGEEPLEPLYTLEQTEAILSCFKPVPYQQAVSVAPGIQAIWAEAGHMLGSASIQLIVHDNGQQKRIVFSGDLGPKGIPILRDFEPFKQADMVFLESTYGDHDHRPFKETVEEFIRIVADAVNARGKILVPTFAVGRAQLLTTLLGSIFRNQQIPPFPVFLDSPMAIEALNIYRRHQELYDEEMTAFVAEKPLAADLKTMTLSVTAEDSKKINDQPGPCFIMAGAGMCNGGRILHHLKQNLWKPETHVLIVGYQSHESLGRRLVDGEEMVSIHGEKVAVKARIHTLGGFSAHAGQTDLLNWFSVIAPCQPRVVLTHGEDGPRGELARLIQQRHNLRPALPGLGEVIEL
ncbi:MAG TPA: MBL fold metallo-hydrolase [Verrucomicrobiae bacterium]|nr:MBL fold metallo-hydrolase [Verrucomicrobiae bacterium]